MRDVLGEDIFKRSASAAASEFFERVYGFWLELIYISFIVSIKSNLTNPHDFQLLLLLP